MTNRSLLNFELFLKQKCFLNIFYMYNILFLFLFLLFIVLKNKDNDFKISVLILSYKRPWNLKKSVPALLKLNMIDEIIILHGHKDFKEEINLPRVKNIDDWLVNNEIYTMRRFKNINYCKNENVLILDDDLLPNQELINRLVKLYKKDKNNFYGPFMRMCDKKKYKSVQSNYNTVLTGLILTSKTLVNNVWKEMENDKKLYDVVVKQKGNCEDLFFNHAFKKIYKKKPVGLLRNTSKYYLDNTNGFSNSGDSLHYKLRGKFCKMIDS